MNSSTRQGVTFHGVDAGVGITSLSIEFLGTSRMNGKILRKAANLVGSEKVEGVSGQASHVAGIHLFFVEGCLNFEERLHFFVFFSIILLYRL